MDENRTTMTDTTDARDRQDMTLSEDRPGKDNRGNGGRPLHTDDLLAGRDATNDRGKSVGEGDQRRTEEERPPLFSDPEDFRQRWEAIQTGFVDEPRHAVESADSLVAEVIQQLVQSFADERDRLEGQWSRGNEASTEDLRLALRRYRSFFDRLLST